MSERDLRTQAENIFSMFIEGDTIDVFEDIRVWRGELEQIKQALFAEPDVVRILWYLKTKAEDYKKQEKMISSGIGVSPVRRQELEILTSHIEKAFHIHLTETGWEWTDCST